MELNRRAVFFTITAFLFLSLLVILLAIGLHEERVDTGLASVVTLSSTREQFDTHYAPMVLRYAAYQTLVALSNDSATHDRNLILPGDFEEAIMTGSYRGNAVTNMQTLPVAYNAFAQAVADADIAQLAITVQWASVQQVGTFYARATAAINYTLVSRDNHTVYNRTLNLTTDFSLVGVTDAYYARKSAGTPFSESRAFHIFTRSRWNNAEFDRMWSEGSYTADAQSPSIFDRLQGQNVPNTGYGILTLIPRSFTPQGGHTSVDAEYFLPTTESCLYTANGINSALRLNWTRLVSFNISSGTLLPPGTGCLSPP